jgi:hypothetical protein
MKCLSEPIGDPIRSLGGHRHLLHVHTPTPGSYPFIIVVFFACRACMTLARAQWRVARLLRRAPTGTRPTVCGPATRGPGRAG